MKTSVLHLLTFAAFCATAAHASDYVRTCYYSNWAQYRPGQGKFEMSHIDPFLCTHMIYSFVEIGSNNELKLREWNGATLIRESMLLKKTNPELKISAGVGGWNFGTEAFTAVCKDESTMQHFARTAVTFLRQYGFDGLDLDWEYPGSRGSPVSDKPKFTQLIRIIKEEFERETKSSWATRLMLTSAVAAGDDEIERGYEMKEICDLLDYIHIMTYDFHGGSFDDLTGHNAPLFGNTGLPSTANFNVDAAVQAWIGAGCSRSKLVMGLPTYGRTFTLTDANNYGYNASSSGPGTAGQYTREAGFLAYYEICTMIGRGQIVNHVDVSAPALVVGDQWIGYDDKESLRTKIQYMKGMGLAGVMIWALDDDDFNAICGEKYPLLRTTYYELVGENSPACFVQPTTNAYTCWYPQNPETPDATTTTTEGPMQTTTTKPVEPATTTTEAPVPTTTTTTEAAAGGVCPSPGIHPDPEDCASYYNCDVSLNGYHYTCAAGLLFNKDSHTCDWAVNVNCK